MKQILIFLTAIVMVGCLIGGTTVYSCDNGTPSPDPSIQFVVVIEKCQACDENYTLTDERCVITQCEDRYTLENDQCEPIEYTCANGEPEIGTPPSGNEDIEQCISCDLGFTLNTTTNSCE